MTKQTGVAFVLLALAAWAVAGVLWSALEIERSGSPSITTVGAAHAATNRGPRGLGFSCDVNTRECKCDGKWEGADCEAMKKNCDLTKIYVCAIEPPYGCTCTMAKAIKRPKASVRPTVPPATIQGKPN